MSKKEQGAIWQTMDTAPKYGTEILAYYKDVETIENTYSSAVIKWDGRYWMGGYYHYEPTGWQPITPPTREQIKAGE